ncbi:MAG: hypothetical protein ACYS6I_06230 [Planctomycetota bacterium]|jgi:hypothetical protein
MRLIAKIAALTSLLLLTLPSALYLAGKVGLDTVKPIMILATIVWFVSASYWMWPDVDTENSGAVSKHKA